VIALYGLGGVGKTQVAVQYAYLHKHEYDLVLWITAESIEDFQHGLEELAGFLNISTDQKQPPQILKEITQTLRIKRKWLLLIDNVEDLADSQPIKKGFFNLFGIFQKKRNELTIIRDFLAEIKDYGKVILTTRLPSINPMVETIEIEKMQVIEGTIFLLKRARKVEENFEKHRDFKLAKKLVEKMDGLPLALEQAAAFITEEPCSFQEYLHIYQQHKAELLARRGTFSHPHDHPLSLTVTLEIVFEKLKKQHRKTLKLLEYCALLPPDSMPEIVFHQLFHVDHLGFMDILKPAVRHSLLKREVDHKQLLIHRLVQTVLKFNLNASEQKYLFSYLIDALAVLLPDDRDINNWHLFKKLRPLVFICFDAINQYHIKTFNAASLLNTMAAFLKEAAGNYQQALPLFQKATEIAQQTSGIQSQNYAASLNNLAELYEYMGENEKALPLFEEALKIDEKVYGRNHPDFATDINNLAGLYRAMGENEKALPLFEESLKIRKEELGTQHPDYANSIIGLASLYYSMGEYEKALPLFEESMKITKKVLGNQHPDYANSIWWLATYYHRIEYYEKALPLYEESLKIFERVLGEEHPHKKILKTNYEDCLAESKEFMLKNQTGLSKPASFESSPNLILPPAHENEKT
jgi:tetratricopeptide (TPR) repeat protein